MDCLKGIIWFMGYPEISSSINITYCRIQKDHSSGCLCHFHKTFQIPWLLYILLSPCQLQNQILTGLHQQHQSSPLTLLVWWTHWSLPHTSFIPCHSHQSTYLGIWKLVTLLEPPCLIRGLPPPKHPYHSGYHNRPNKGLNNYKITNPWENSPHPQHP